eukprot:g26580.t1
MSVSSAQTSGREEPIPDLRPHPGENQVMWTVWLTYGAFYFCRTNLSAALPGIEKDLDYSKADMGIVLLSLKLAYATGQLINGQLSERLSPRKMLAIGMFGSAALNILFGFGTAVYFFLFVWAANGFVQSMGWTPCVRVIGNWIPILRRGKVIGIVGTGYQVTAALTYLLSGFGVWLLGWQGALWIPPIVLVGSAIVMLVFLRESPDSETAAARSTANDTTPQSNQPQRSFLDTFRLTISNRALWLLALSLGMLNACRYGFVDWGISHLVAVDLAKAQRLEIQRLYDSPETPSATRERLAHLLSLDLLDDKTQDEDIQQAIKDDVLPDSITTHARGSVLKSAVKYAVLPIGAIFGSFLAGWATDRFFGGRRAPVIFGLLIILGGLTILYPPIARASFTGTVALLILVGFCIYGPQVLLVGTAPADLARDGTSAAAAGFVNCVGYIGAAILGDLLTGYLAQEYGWKIAIYAWAGWAFAIIIGAGRGSRLMPTTADTPKCFAEVGDRRILDWTLHAFAENGIDDICFIGGYRIETVQQEYPQFTFRHNDDWPNNNILASLFYAEDRMEQPFICCYSDTLFSPEVVSRAKAASGDVSLVVDTDWLDRYTHRTEHPSDDAEKVTVHDGRVTRVHREIPEPEAHGEYIGVAKFSAEGAGQLRKHYHRRREEFAGRPYREAAVFEKAYLIHLLQDMIEEGVSMSHVDTPGDYIEIDTQQDFEYARNAAIASVVALQECAGLDMVSDGEWWRKSYIGVIAELAHGFELSLNPADGRPWTIVVDQLSPKTPGFISREVGFLKTLTNRQIKATLPAPSLLGERMWDADKSSKAYPTRESFVEACVPILRKEVELLREEGVSVVQIDDPHLCLFVDGDVRAQYDDPDKAADFAVEMTNRVVDGFDDIKLAVHLCRRAGARARGEAAFSGGYGPIISQLNRLKVDHLTMEFTTPGAGEMSVFKDLRDDVEIGLGCVNCHPGEIDSAETVFGRVETALKYLPADRITLNPDCGFAPGSAANVSLDEVFVKLQNEVAAARQLRETYAAAS